MSKPKKAIIEVRGAAITILSQPQSDFISLTDIARYKDSERTDYIIQNWLRNRNTIRFMKLRCRAFIILHSSFCLSGDA